MIEIHYNFGCCEHYYYFFFRIDITANMAFVINGLFNFITVIDIGHITLYTLVHIIVTRNIIVNGMCLCLPKYICIFIALWILFSARNGCQKNCYTCNCTLENTVAIFSFPNVALFKLYSFWITS